MEVIQIIEKLNQISEKLDEQKLLKKEVLCFKDVCQYLDLSASHLYKLTSQKAIPHFCPQGKKLYFKREDLDQWLLRNRQDSTDEVEAKAANYLLKNRKKN
jgi:excisionase family DNA binding protein